MKKLLLLNFIFIFLIQINSQAQDVDCVDDDLAAAQLANMWNPSITGCEDAIPYLQAAGYPCDTDLSVLGMSGTIADICECTCEEEIDVYGCTDIAACNYNELATIDNGTCGLVDDCGDCQVPYCYDMMINLVSYISETDCVDGLWIGNDCENNPYCLSSPENLYWNSGCNNFIYEQSLLKEIVGFKDLLGRNIKTPIFNSPFLVVYSDGSTNKIIIKKQ